MDLVLATNIVKTTQTHINCEKYTICVIKSLEPLKNLKTGRIPYLDLEPTMHVLKSQTHLETVLLNVLAHVMSGFITN
jgi:hypothetical protein